MAKLKVVISLHVGSNPKKRSKALKTAVGFPGVTKAALEGDKNKLEIEGEGLDPVKLTVKLKKKLGYAELLAVKKADEKDDKKLEHIPIVSANPWSWGGGNLQHYYYYDADEPYRNTCAII